VLGKIGDKRAIPALKQMLNHKNRDRRLWAGYGLAELGDPLGVPVVAEFLKNQIGAEAARCRGSGDLR